MQTGPRAAIVRVLAALAVIAFVGAGALLAIGPNRTADWTASDCGAPIRWLTDDHPYDSVIVPFSDAPKPWSVATAAADCRSAVWHQIHRAAALGAASLGLVVTSLLVARTRRSPGVRAPLIAS